ncbi:hypothetical protein R1flu_018482 [Riccia fluitans]|uniref:Uncharacterized protein n=1 Tax=Riccia fluitans TaxID=41844 RepID=A0ABD1ZFZ2_9MARC
MVFPNGRPVDVGSSDVQEHELRASLNHNSVASLDQAMKEIPGTPVVKVDAGSGTCTLQGDQGCSRVANDSSVAQGSYDDGSLYGVAASGCRFNQENALCNAGTLQHRVGESSGSIAPVTTAASSVLSSSTVPNSVMFPMRLNAELSGTWSGLLDSDNPIRSSAATCESSALGRAGNTGSIDVVSRSGLACQIRSNSIRSSCFFGRPTVEHPMPDSSFVPVQETARNSGNGSRLDSSEELNRDSGALRWVQALELQGTGACRADERLRPLLRWNVSCVGADGRLLVQFGQHFKAKELNLLARCLCAPLVHIRVGKVLREGRLLRPITSRGFLSLTIVPGSDLRLSFVPDEGFEDLLATISLYSESPSVALEEVPADVSGRTFLLKLSDGKVLYFWQSEKSKSSGDELVSKMKDMLYRRPTLSELTGIEESRLDSFTGYVCSVLNALSSTEAVESIASAASTESSHSSNPGSSTSYTSSSIPYSSRTDPRASSSETRTLSLPTAFARWRSDFEGGSSPCGDGLSQVVSLREESNANLLALSAPCTSSSVSWPDSFGRRHATLRGAGLSSICHSAGFRGASEGSSSTTPDQPVLLASSWSTRTSLSDSSQETSSLSAGLYTSLNADLKGHGQSVFGNQYRTCPVAPQNIAALSLRNSLPAFLAEAPSTSSTRTPLVPAHPPVSPASVLAPYYCPCPLGSFAPPYVPSSTDGGLLSPSAPYFSVRPPASLFPPGSLSFHEFSLSPVHLPLSTLVTAAIPIDSSGVTPVCSQPVSSVPILHTSNPYMVRTSSTSSGFNGTTTESLEKPFYSCLRARQSIHDDSCSVNLYTSLCSGVSAWQSPSSSLEAFMPVFDSSLSLTATSSCINPSIQSAMQTQRPVLDENLAGNRGLWGFPESGIGTQTSTMFTSGSMSQITPFELGLHYASRYVEENHEATTTAIVDRVSSISIDLRLDPGSFFADMSMFHLTNSSELSTSSDQLMMYL